MKILLSLGLAVLSVVFISCSSRQVSVVKNDSRPTLSVAQTGVIGPKKKLAVADFKMEAVYGQTRLGNVAADILITELQQTGRFILVERAKLATVMDEKKLAMSGLADSSDAVTLGQLLGADAIITGSVTKFGVNVSSSDVLLGDSKTQTATAEVNVRLVDVGSGKILLAESGSGKAERSYSSVLGIGSTGGYDEALEGDAVKAAIADVVERIVNSMDQVKWSCKIAQKNGDGTVIIDAGQDSRLAIGQKLTVIKMGPAIKSPSSGEIIGYSEKKVGTIEVTDYFGNNGANCKIVKDSGITGGDTCRIVE